MKISKFSPFLWLILINFLIFQVNLIKSYCIYSEELESDTSLEENENYISKDENEDYTLNEENEDYTTNEENESAEKMVKICGGKICGGRKEEKGEAPFYVQLVESNEQFCGGSIISTNWILTAAHCLEENSISKLSVIAGRETRANHKPEIDQQIFKFLKIVKHPLYNRRTLENDIGLIQIKGHFSFNKAINATELSRASQMDIRPGTSSIAYGFGQQTEMDFSSTSNVLLKVELPILSQASCQAVYRTKFYSKSMFCAGDLQIGGKDTCQGDSGGPLICKDNQRSYLCGITSWGIGCGRRGFPGVYSKVSNYIDWINHEIPQNLEATTVSTTDNLSNMEEKPKTNKMDCSSEDNSCLDGLNKLQLKNKRVLAGRFNYHVTIHNLYRYEKLYLHVQYCSNGAGCSNVQKIILEYSKKHLFWGADFSQDYKIKIIFYTVQWMKRKVQKIDGFVYPLVDKYKNGNLIYDIWQDCAFLSKNNSRSWKEHRLCWSKY